MAREDQVVELEARQFTLYSLRIHPLWEGEAECIELGSNLQVIIDTIVRERSVSYFLGNNLKPMRFCQLEQEEAITLVRSGKIFYGRERTPVWKVMIPTSGVYSRETILSCMARSAGRNIEKYENALFNYPKAVEFYTFSNNEIRPVDESVFVIKHHAR